MRPDSFKNHGHVVRQWCSSGATRPPAEESIPCPIKDGTSVCQFHDGCNLQPVRPAVVAAELLKMSELKCAKTCLNKEAILATAGNDAQSPKTSPTFRDRFQDRFSVDKIGFPWQHVVFYHQLLPDDVWNIAKYIQAHTMARN